MKNLLLTLILFGGQVSAAEPATSPVHIPIDEHTFLYCSMQIQTELQQGFVDLTTCHYCQVINEVPLCVSNNQKPQSLNSKIK